MSNYIKEIKAISIFLLIIAGVLGILSLLSIPGIEIWVYRIIVGYISVCAFAVLGKVIFKNKYTNYIAKITLTPGYLIWILSYFLIPFGTLFIHLMMYFSISFAFLFLLFEFLYKFGFIEFLSKSTLLYLQITSCVFVSVLFNYQIRKLIYKISPARIQTSQKLKPFELDKLTDYLISERNIKFLIYSSYVVILIGINFHKFQPNTSLYYNSIIDDAVLQSFITFIAFDKVTALLKELEFKPSDLLLKINNSISNKFEDLRKEDS